MRPPAKVLVIGSSNTDLVLSCGRLPRPGETLLGGSFERFAGGKGANQAVAAARAGAPVIFIGARGGDDFGEAAHAALRKEKIDVRFFSAKKNLPSGVALILLGGKTRENMIAVARSANDAVTPADIRKASPAFASAGAVVCQLEIPLPAILEAARLAEKHRIPFCSTPRPPGRSPERCSGRSIP
jgi:ribokinase